MAGHGSQYNTYGAAQLESGLSGLTPKQIMPKQRVRMSLRGICISTFFPWILFSFLYWDVTFSLHYSFPLLCWAIVALGIVITVAIGVAAWQKLQDSKSNWLLFLFFSTAYAAVFGPLLGNINYWLNTQPYYDLQTLETYSDVNPATTPGQKLMDAGKVEFAEVAGLDLSKAFQFQDLDTYCVAPISLGLNSSVKSYDFWAVGLNCCGWNASGVIDYKCGGDYQTTTARQGVRLLNENQRDYYRLAVEQAEAQYKINAKYPLFFYWTEDATTDIQSYWEYGFKYYLLGVGMFIISQIFSVIAATVLFSKFEF